MLDTHGSTSNRTCGTCTLCCRMMVVAPIGKPAECDCPALGHDGCSIYDDRPDVCRGFRCLWLADQDGLLADEDRPDRVGIVLTDDGAAWSDRHGVIAREAWAGAAATVRAMEMIKYLRQFLPVRVAQSARMAPVPLTINGGISKAA